MAYGISGVVNVAGSPLSGATVVLMDRGVVPRVLQRQVTDGSGNYIFTGLTNGSLYTVVAYDPAGGTDYNALVWDKVAPVSMSLTDPHWESVVLLVGNDNAANGSVVFEDYSLKRNQIRAFGNAAYSNSQAPTGMTTSMIFDGTADKIQALPGDDFNFSGVDFTVELYWYHQVSTDQVLWDQRVVNSAGASDAQLAVVGTSGLRAIWNGTNRITIANPGQNAWHHYALCGVSGTVTAYSDGVSGGTFSQAGFVNARTPFNIGASGDIAAGASLQGFIACCRVTKGVGRYTAGFTPPTLPLPTN